MTFWQSESGSVIDGSAENSHVGTFKIIPDNTQAPVTIKNIEIKSIQGDNFYQATYKIIDGDFKGYEVRHKIKCFDNDAKKRDREVNMLMRLYKLCDRKPSSTNAPTNEDLLPLKGCMIGVKIQEWFMDGKEGNWISEIHPIGSDFVTSSGKKIEHIANLESAFSRSSTNENLTDDQIPF